MTAEEPPTDEEIMALIDRCNPAAEAWIEEEPDAPLSEALLEAVRILRAERSPPGDR
jgi:hypothetical protein